MQIVCRPKKPYKISMDGGDWKIARTSPIEYRVLGYTKSLKTAFSIVLVDVLVQSCARTAAGH